MNFSGMTVQLLFLQINGYVSISEHVYQNVTQLKYHVPDIEWVAALELQTLLLFFGFNGSITMSLILTYTSASC